MPAVDPRGLRFGAWITSGVLAAVLLTRSTPVLAAQAAVFVLGATSLRRAPYGWVFRRLVAPRLGPPPQLEPAGPPRFAQAVGAAFAVVGTAGFLAGLGALGQAATAAALVAALLNASVGLCLGCEIYLGLTRLRALLARTTRPARPAPHGAATAGSARPSASISARETA